MRESYWQRRVSWSDREQPRSYPNNVDFAVIGGGYSGLSTAIQLRECNPSAAIVLLEAERVGYGASGRNAGFLSPVAAPIWLLGADRSTEQAWAAARLNKEIHAIAKWLKESVPDTEICNASLSIEACGRLSDCGLGEFARALDFVGLSYHLADSHVRRGHLCLKMDAYMVDPYKLVLGLANYADLAGIDIRERARVRAVETASDGVCVTLDGGEQLSARRVIVCTNAYTSTLDVGERIRALAVHSFMLASEPLGKTVLSEAVRDGDFTVELNTVEAYHRLHDDRIVYGGIDKVFSPAGGDFAVPNKVQSRLIRQMHRSYPGIGPIAITDAWSGKFHATATGLPILRSSKKNPAVILNVGYGGTGVALALVCSRLVAAIASGEQFASEEDARLLSIIQTTRVPVRDAVRAVGRLACRLAT